MATEQAIIENAIIVLNEDLSASLEKVAEHSGITRRTLHRHFKDRDTLLMACYQDMLVTWQVAVRAAIKSSTDPVKQLENILYAGINCGVKYALMNKLLANGLHTPEIIKQYNSVTDRWFNKIPALQEERIITAHLPVSWIKILLANMIMAGIQATRRKSVQKDDIAPLAWYSFRKSIGIK